MSSAASELGTNGKGTTSVDVVAAPSAIGPQQQSVSSNKRSLALTYGRCDDRDAILENFPDHKYYSWGTAAPCDVEQFTAMVWGGRDQYRNQIAAVQQSIQGQPVASRWVLGPNECDLGGQCNMSVREVAVLWKEMEDALLPLGAKLVFPVPTHGGADDDWIWKVVGKYRQLYGKLPTVDRFALHAYMSAIGAGEPARPFKEFIDRQAVKLAAGGTQNSHDGPCGLQMQGTECVFDARTVFKDDDGSTARASTKRATRASSIREPYFKTAPVSESSRSRLTAVTSITPRVTLGIAMATPSPQCRVISPGRIERYFWFTNRINGNEWWGNGWQSCSLIDPTTDQLKASGRYYAGK